MSAAGYVLQPVRGLDREAVDTVRRVYEDGFTGRLRADFTTLTDQPEGGDTALALVQYGQPCGFAMVRRLGSTRWRFLRYFVVDQRLRGQGLGGVMWEKLTTRVRAGGCTLLVFDVEDPAEPAGGAVEAQIRSRRIGFYERHGARLLPVRGYQTPHGNADEEDWTPMLLMAAPVAAGATAPGAVDVPAIVSAVYRHRWRLEPGHPRIRGTQITDSTKVTLPGSRDRIRPWQANPEAEDQKGS